MRLIADTNVWYDIAAGRRDPAQLKTGGNTLIATPTSLMEIASLIDSKTLVERRAAAQAVLGSADLVIEDSEFHLTEIWNLQPSNPNIPWREAFVAIANATSAAELEKGVADFNQRVSRKLNVPLVAVWREYYWNDFKNGVENAVEHYVPGYKAARSKGKVKFLNKKKWTTFAQAIKSAGARRQIVNATFSRALLVMKQADRAPTEAECAHAEPLLAPYVDAYTEYFFRCATIFAPQSNDLGDSECLVYLQNDARFLSSDKRWVRIARAACPGHILDPENKVPL